MMEIKALQQKFARPGKVVFIGVRPKRLEPVISLERVNAISDLGLEGDRYKNSGGSRQVTIIQAEHIEAVSSFLGREVKPEQLRRNIVIAGINLLSFKGKRFKVGAVVFEYTGECHPCSRMEENLGEGGYNAMRGHGGITAKILEGGSLQIGDTVTLI